MGLADSRNEERVTLYFSWSGRVNVRTRVQLKTVLRRTSLRLGTSSGTGFSRPTSPVASHQALVLVQQVESDQAQIRIYKGSDHRVLLLQRRCCPVKTFCFWVNFFARTNWLQLKNDCCNNPRSIRKSFGNIRNGSLKL